MSNAKWMTNGTDMVAVVGKRMGKAILYAIDDEGSALAIRDPDWSEWTTLPDLDKIPDLVDPEIVLNFKEALDDAEARLSQVDRGQGGSINSLFGKWYARDDAGTVTGPFDSREEADIALKKRQGGSQ